MRRLKQLDWPVIDDGTPGVGWEILYNIFAVLCVVALAVFFWFAITHRIDIA